VLNSRYSVLSYKRAQQARVLHYTGLDGLASDKHSSLLSPFIKSENEVFYTALGAIPIPSVVGFWPKIRLGRDCLSGTNALAYFRLTFGVDKKVLKR
jgi:hypothetical protein